MPLVSSQSWGYGRREFRAEAVASSRAAAVSGRKDPRHRSKRSQKRLRGDSGQIVGVRP
jgi:hypothetical protein